MKPFTLGTVLSYRQRLEDIAKIKLQEAQAARQEVQEKLDRQKEIYSSLLATTEQLQQEGVNITELLRYEEHITYVKNGLMTLRNELIRKHKQVDQERQALLAKSRERRIMEKLKEKQNAAWRQYLNKKEAAQLDEIAVLYHNR